MGRRARHAPVQQPAACGCQRVINAGHQRAFAPARKAMGQLKVSPRGRVDLHDPVGLFAHWRVEAGHLPFLRDLQIVENRPHG